MVFAGLVLFVPYFRKSPTSILILGVIAALIGVGALRPDDPPVDGVRARVMTSTSATGTLPVR